MAKKEKLFAPRHAGAARAFIQQVTSTTASFATSERHSHLCARLRRIAHAVQFVVLAIGMGTVGAVFAAASSNAAWISPVIWAGVTTGLAVLILGIALRNIAWFLDPDDEALDADSDDAALMRATDRSYEILSWPFFPVIFFAVWLRDRSALAHSSARAK